MTCPCFRTPIPHSDADGVPKVSKVWYHLHQTSTFATALGYMTSLAVIIPVNHMVAEDLIPKMAGTLGIFSLWTSTRYGGNETGEGCFETPPGSFPIFLWGDIWQWLKQTPGFVWRSSSVTILFQVATIL